MMKHLACLLAICDTSPLPSPLPSFPLPFPPGPLILELPTFRNLFFLLLHPFSLPLKLKNKGKMKGTAFYDFAPLFLLPPSPFPPGGSLLPNRHQFLFD